MKAIEIDWSKSPEGTTHYLPENDEKCWAACWFKQVGDVWECQVVNRHEDVWETDDDMDEAVEFLIPRPSAWNGTSLPPVGIVCERCWDSDDGSHHQVKILAHDGDYAIFRWIDGPRNGEIQEDIQEVIGEHRTFRRIRTPEQIAAEEREKAVNEMWMHIYEETPLHTPLLKKSCADLYDAGYRKVEGDKQ